MWKYDIVYLKLMKCYLHYTSVKINKERKQNVKKKNQSIDK